jgi:hypothetical protein
MVTPCGGNDATVDATDSVGTVSPVPAPAPQHTIKGGGTTNIVLVSTATSFTTSIPAALPPHLMGMCTNQVSTVSQRPWYFHRKGVFVQ